MDAENIEIVSKKIVIGSFWIFIDRLVTQFVSFFVSIILARLLVPEIYGTVALVTIFITIADVFVSSGLGYSLVQKKMPDIHDYSTALIAGLAISIVSYMLLFISAPCISAFYGKSELILVIRIMSIRILFAAINSIQSAYVQKQYKFRVQFFAGLSSSIVSGCIGIFLAMKGFGVWALVTQNLLQAGILTIMLGLVSGLRVYPSFSMKRLAPLFSFGWKVLLLNLIDTLYVNVGGLFIGRRYSSADLAFYNRGNQLSGIIVGNINSTITTVMFPALADAQDDSARVKTIARSSMKNSTYIMSPLLVGLAVCAEPIVKLLLTDKWIGSVIYVQIFSIVYLSMPLNSINQLIINSLGRSDIFLRNGIIKKFFGIASIIISVKVFGGPISIAIASLIDAPITCYINSKPNKKLIDYGLSEQLQDILPPILLSVAMGIFVRGLRHIPGPLVWVLVTQILLGALFYIVGSKFLKFKEFEGIYIAIKSLYQERLNKKLQ